MEDVFMIGKKLKQLRSFYNYSQEYVAAQLDVQKSTYSDYELGNVKISPERLMKAAELYKVDHHIFFTQTPLSITMNDHASNGYVEQQHNGDKALYERMLQHMEERSKKLEELYAKSLELFDRFAKKD
jgi:transcriptional regulator with XRE-family HTH domain